MKRRTTLLDGGVIRGQHLYLGVVYVGTPSDAPIWPHAIDHTAWSSIWEGEALVELDDIANVRRTAVTTGVMYPLRRYRSD